MKRKIYAPLAVIFFILLVAQGQSFVCDTVTLGQAVFRAVLFAVGWVWFTYKAGGFYGQRRDKHWI